jgi:hypothetical protein
MYKLKKYFINNDSTLRWKSVIGVLIALVLVFLMLFARDTEAAKLHPGDISGMAAPVTIVCTDPQALTTILMQQSMDAVANAGTDMARAGRCMSLPAPAMVILAEAVGFVMVPKEVTGDVNLRATVYRVQRKDMDANHPQQYYVYALEEMVES